MTQLEKLLNAFSRWFSRFCQTHPTGARRRAAFSLLLLTPSLILLTVVTILPVILPDCHQLHVLGSYPTGLA